MSAGKDLSTGNFTPKVAEDTGKWRHPNPLNKMTAAESTVSMMALLEKTVADTVDIQATIQVTFNSSWQALTYSLQKGEYDQRSIRTLILYYLLFFRNSISGSAYPQDHSKRKRFCEELMVDVLEKAEQLFQYQKKRDERQNNGRLTGRRQG
ncbi:unnamed protein product [Caretta caretta]